MIAPGKISTLFGKLPGIGHRRVLDLDDIIDNCSHELVTALHSVSSPIEKLQILDDFLQIHGTKKSMQPAFLDHALQVITQTNGKITVAELSKRVNCSSRHLRRTFIQHFGIGPKIFSSIIRLHDTVGRLVASEDSVADIISDGGYFDRAHFYKEFIRIVGMKPGDYFRHRRILSRNFFSESRLNKGTNSVSIVRM